MRMDNPSGFWYDRVQTEDAFVGEVVLHLLCTIFPGRFFHVQPFLLPLRPDDTLGC